MRRILDSFLCVILTIIGLKAQDMHQSQFYTSPININPALTGNFYGDYRVALNYRNQWFVNDLANYLTLTASVDHRFYPKKWTQKGIWSAGLIINYDQAGDSKLGLTNFGLSASYSYPLNKKNIVALGGLIGGSYRKFSTGNLTWDNQWNGTSFDPQRPTGENISGSTNSFLDLSGGLQYRWQKSRRTKFDLGAGLFHVNEPSQIFYSSNSTIKLFKRLSLYALPSFRITRYFDILLHGMHQIQGPYSETVVGGYGKVYVETKRGKELSILLGVASRLEDAFIPKIAVEYKNWYAGVSYDINTSPFKKATNRRGGPEFALIYTFVKARPLDEIRACPIY